MADNNALSLNRYLKADECLWSAIESSTRADVDRAMAVLGVLELAAISPYYEMGSSVHLVDGQTAQKFADKNQAVMAKSPNFLAARFIDRSVADDVLRFPSHVTSSELFGPLSFGDLLALVELVETLVSNSRIERFVDRVQRGSFRRGSRVLRGLSNLLAGLHPDQDLVDFYHFTLGVHEFVVSDSFERTTTKDNGLMAIAVTQFGALYSVGPLTEIFASLNWRDPDSAEVVKVRDTIRRLADWTANQSPRGRPVTAGQ